jgi:hypothetical protein
LRQIRQQHRFAIGDRVIVVRPGADQHLVGVVVLVRVANRGSRNLACAMSSNSIALIGNHMGRRISYSDPSQTGESCSSNDGWTFPSIRGIAILLCAFDR